MASRCYDGGIYLTSASGAVLGGADIEPRGNAERVRRESVVFGIMWPRNNS